MRMFRTSVFVIINVKKITQLSLTRECLNVVYMHITILDSRENEQVSLRNVVLRENKQTAEDYNESDTIFIKLKTALLVFII